MGVTGGTQIIRYARPWEAFGAGVGRCGPEGGAGSVTVPGAALGVGIRQNGKIMRVFVRGASGALGRHLVPALAGAGYEVTATTRTPGKAGRLRVVGAEPVVVDGLDRGAVIAAVRAAGPEVIVHEMTALAGMRGFRDPGKLFAATNQLRTRGTGNLLAAAAVAGTRRVIAQSYAGAGPPGSASPPGCRGPAVRRPRRGGRKVRSSPAGSSRPPRAATWTRCSACSRPT